MGVYTFNDGTTDLTVTLDDWDNKIVSGDKDSKNYWNEKWNFAPEVKEAITLSSYESVSYTHLTLPTICSV